MSRGPTAKTLARRRLERVRKDAEKIKELYARPSPLRELAIAAQGQFPVMSALPWPAHAHVARLLAQQLRRLHRRHAAVSYPPTAARDGAETPGVGTGVGALVSWRLTTWIALLMAVGALTQFAELALHLQRGQTWWADLLVGLMCAGSSATNANASLVARKGSSRS